MDAEDGDDDVVARWAAPDDGEATQAYAALADDDDERIEVLDPEPGPVDEDADDDNEEDGAEDDEDEVVVADEDDPEADEEDEDGEDDADEAEDAAFAAEAEAIDADVSAYGDSDFDDDEVDIAPDAPDAYPEDAHPRDAYGDDAYTDATGVYEYDDEAAYPVAAAYPVDDDDDPLPPRPLRPPGALPRPPPGRLSRAPRAIVLKQRRRRRRFIIGLTIFLSVTVSTVGTSYVYLQYRLGQIPRVDVPSLVEDQQGEIMNVLLVGSDSRDRLEGQAALQAGKGVVSGQRSDTIMVLHIDPEQEQAAILSIPRDLYLPIAGEGYSDRVNAAFALGGAQGLIETIQQSLGITINHYVEVDFVGFKDIVDAVGGVTLYIPAWVRDFTSGLDIHELGCVDVDGTQGLAWVRSRNFEILQPDGLTWVPDPRADLGRIERQQDFIRRMLKKALSSGITNPLQLNRLIGIGVRDVTLDETLSTKDITTLARRFNNLDANTVALLTLPTTPADVDGASVLQLREEEAKPYLDRINGVEGAAMPTPGAGIGPTTTVPTEALVFPADVEVRVLNGEGTPGAAAEAASALESAGFDVAGTGDATEIPFTTIRHSEEALAEAQLLQRALAGGAKLVVDDTVTSTDVVLVIGFDYEGLSVGPVGPIPRPSTTIDTTAGGTGTTTTSVDTTSTTTAPPTTMGPTTLPPGVEC